ncbi:MAG: hypothetical protein Q9170_002830 [Blastenia crenularia]
MDQQGNDEVPLFTAVSGSARQLFSLLRCINFAKKAQIHLTEEGLRFTVEESRVIQGVAFLERALFTSYTFSPPASSQAENGEPKSSDEDNDSNDAAVFQISLTALLETLQIFGFNEGKDRWTSRDSGYRGVTSSLARGGPNAAFQSSTLDMPSVCRFCYAAKGEPLRIVLQEAGVTTTCEMVTYEPEDQDEIPLQRDALAQKIIMRSSWLHDAIIELASTSPSRLTIVASPTAPHFTLSSNGALGSATVEFSKDQQLLETFQVPRRTVNTYKYSLVKAASRAMGIASKVSIRGDEQGVLNLQFMIAIDEGRVSFVDFRFVPFLPEDGEGENESEEEGENEEAKSAVSMRIPIREQLGLLVLLTSLVALAVISIATWVNNYNFVVGIRLSRLSLTASLYANQLRADLTLMQSSVLAAATRVIVQNALQRYNQGNNTDANWPRAETDLQSALSGRGSASMLVQARVVSKNGTGVAGPYGLINVTAQDVTGQIPMPYQAPNGSTIFFGDDGAGYPPSLYPNLTFTSTVLNDTFNVSTAYFNGVQLYSDTTLFLGPVLLNASLTLVSVTSPIINNTSDADILGWLTIVINGSSLFSLRDATEGLGNTGEILIVGPTTQSGRLPEGILSGQNDGKANRSLAKTQPVTYILPPVANSSRSTRHLARDWTQANTSFEMQQYPAVLDAYSEGSKRSSNNGGSILSTRNEEKKHISSGYALARSPLVDWLLLVEQSYDEVHAPIDRLRNILVACVFGTAGLLLLIVFPVAHLSVRPIRRLREATKKTVEPYRYSDDNTSVRSSFSAYDDGAGARGAGDSTAEARKEGFLGRLAGWGADRQKQKEQRERDRRGTFRIPGKVQDRKHVVNDELTDLTTTFNEMSEELVMQYERLEERVRERTTQLEISKKAAEAANESKTLFIANISHELKTPLNGILGMCAVCMQEDDPTKIKRSLGIIYKSGDLLLHLLTDLLQFSRNQMGQQLALDEREFRLADISNQILSIFDKQAKEGSINFSLTFQGPQDIAGNNDVQMMPLQSGFGPWGTGRLRDMMLWGDQHRILQVIINLVSNSLKFTPPGGSVFVRIKCAGENEEKPLSRKGSSQSKQSLANSVKSSRRRGRIVSASDSSTPPKTLERDNSGYSDTALQINAAEPKAIPTVAIHERGSSPPPKGARVLMFEFEVEDTGPGIPEAQQQRVFEPFVQGDLGLSKKYGGTGLGLSICSQLASLMKGSIKLSSQEGVGSKFTMQIPLIFTKEKAESTTDSDLGLNSRRNSINIGSLRNEPMTKQKNTSTSDVSVKSSGSAAPAISGFETPVKPRLVGLSQPFFATSAPLESPNQQMEAIERVAAQASQSGDKVRVLVAEDNKVNQEVVLRMLKLEDIYDVTVAKDGQEAYDLVKASMEERNYFNLIFMDVQMPNLDGLQSTRLIRGMGYSAPIVALTAFAEESNVKECMDSGMDFFLPKPIRRPALKQVLKKYCATIPEAVEPEPEKNKDAPTTNGHTGANNDLLSPKAQ